MSKKTKHNSDCRAQYFNNVWKTSDIIVIYIQCIYSPRYCVVTLDSHCKRYQSSSFTYTHKQKYYSNSALLLWQKTHIYTCLQAKNRTTEHQHWKSFLQLQIGTTSSHKIHSLNNSKLTVWIFGCSKRD